tara:strand:+ start:87 stop:485 length:399 start_codon:yes stop_codon:yes gene_type:complete
MKKEFIYNFKVYYEDTDAGGVVYYANYLKFLERARSEAIYSIGFSNLDLKKTNDVIIVVKSCNINYIRPAKFEDKLSVNSSIISISKASFKMNQIIIRQEEKITEAEVVLVAINSSGKPTKLPEELLKKFNS